MNTERSRIVKNEEPAHDDPRENQAQQPRTTMFYDGGCPICSREVEHYRRMDREGRVEWADIDADPGVARSIGLTYEEAMARLHVRDRSGKVLSGAWAFAAVWDELPYYRWLARLLRALRLLPVINLAYIPFAKRRFRRRVCETGTCSSR